MPCYPLGRKVLQRCMWWPTVCRLHHHVGVLHMCFSVLHLLHVRCCGLHMHSWLVWFESRHLPKIFDGWNVGSIFWGDCASIVAQCSLRDCVSAIQLVTCSYTVIMHSYTVIMCRYTAYMYSYTTIMCSYMVIVYSCTGFMYSYTVIMHSYTVIMCSS